MAKNRRYVARTEKHHSTTELSIDLPLESSVVEWCFSVRATYRRFLAMIWLPVTEWYDKRGRGTRARRDTGVMAMETTAIV
jgi:hypothetical protein